jgi:hypothetical protein
VADPLQVVARCGHRFSQALPMTTPSPRVERRGRRPPRRWHVPLLALALILGACGTTATAHGPTKAARASDAAVCGAIDNRYFYYPTIPQGGPHVSPQAARMVESLLRRGSGAWLAEAGTLQKAIETENEAVMISVFARLQQSVCPTIGWTPPT